MIELNGPTWSRIKDPNERAEAVWSTAGALKEVHAPRIKAALENVERYEGRVLGDLNPSKYFTAHVDYSGDPDSYDKLIENECRSIVATAVAKIAGKQKPKGEFVCSEADWDVKRRAKKMGRFIEAQMLARQGNCMDAYGQGTLMFRDAGVTDAGWLKAWADPDLAQWCVRRVPTWEVLVDPTEAQYGEPQNMFHMFAYDRDALIERFPSRKSYIIDASSIDDDAGTQSHYGTDARSRRMVKIVQAWRLPIGKKKPGKMALVINGPGGALDLTVGKDSPQGAEWTRSSFPIFGMTWEPWMMGIYGTSLIDLVKGLNDQLNLSVRRQAEAELLGSNAIIFSRKNSVDKADLEDNRPFIVVEYDGESVPQVNVPNTTSQGSIAWQQQLRSRIHDLSGISEQSATGTTQLGAGASGTAIREENKLGPERFAIQWRAYESIMAVELTRQCVSCMRELAEEIGDDELIAKWPGGEYFRSIKWSEASLEDDQYQVRPEAVSGIINTPADIKALANELADRGWITRETYFSMLQYNDAAEELAGGTAIREWMEFQVDSWLDCTEEEYTDGTFKPRLTPPSWLGIPGITSCIAQVGVAYLKQDMDGCPTWRLDLFERSLIEMSTRLDELNARQSEMQGAARGTTAAVQAVAPAAAQAGPAGAPAAGAPAPALAPPAQAPPPAMH